MKKVSLVLTLMALLALPVHGQLLSNAIRNSVEKFTPGKVTFKDGSEMPYRWIVIPGDGDDKLTVSEDPKHKKKEKIDAAEVVSVTLWSEEFPDSMSTLYYIHADKSPHPSLFFPAPTHAWGYPIAASEWGVIFRCCPIYSIDKKTGMLMEEYYTTTRRVGNMQVAEDVPAFCFLVCDKYENAQHIGSSPAGSWFLHFADMWNPKKHVAPLFDENPAIAQAVADKKLLGRDILFILNEMVAGNTTEEDIDLYLEEVDKAIQKAKMDKKNKKSGKDKAVKKDNKSGKKSQSASKSNKKKTNNKKNSKSKSKK